MYEGLGPIELKTKERVEAGVITGPDLQWAQRLEALLGHKGPIWQWQNSVAARQRIKAEVRYYILHRDGEPLANMMIAERAGVGHFGLATGPSLGRLLRWGMPGQKRSLVSGGVPTPRPLRSDDVRRSGSDPMGSDRSLGEERLNSCGVPF
jgi:hypothetical protein